MVRDGFLDDLPLLRIFPRLSARRAGDVIPLMLRLRAIRGDDTTRLASSYFAAAHQKPRLELFHHVGLLAFRVRLAEASRFLHPPPLVSRQPRALRPPRQEQREQIVHRYAAGLFPHHRTSSVIALKPDAQATEVKETFR